MALRKFAASRIADGVMPTGGEIMRFSTFPSSVTSSTRAEVGESETNSTCRIGASSFGAKTNDAQGLRPDSMDTASSSARVMSPSDRSATCSIWVRSSCETLPISRRPSTNILRPVWVGMRPAEVWGLSRRPRCSRSCITLRTVAADSEVSRLREIVRDPTGSPVSI